MKHLVLAVLALLLFPFSVPAGDLVAQWRRADGGRFTLAVRDDRHIRMDNQAESYMLLSGEKVYMVAREDGHWQVTDMDQMAEMAKMFCGVGSGSASAYETAYRPTGRKEKVAGYQGTVYLAEIRDDKGGLVEKKEVVLSDRQNVVRINQAWVTLISGMGKVMGGQMSKALSDAAKTASKSGYGGVLRVDGDLVLASLKETDMGAQYFSLPADSLSPTGRGQARSPSTQTPASKKQTTAAPAAEESEGVVTRTAKSVGKEVGGVAAKEAKSATINEVREGVKGVFNKLFD